jgi:hypothetical protein
MSPTHRFQPIVKHEASHEAKHEAKFVMNQTYADHEVGGFLYLLNSERVLTPINKHEFPPTLEE